MAGGRVERSGNAARGGSVGHGDVAVAVDASIVMTTVRGDSRWIDAAGGGSVAVAKM